MDHALCEDEEGWRGQRRGFDALKKELFRRRIGSMPCTNNNREGKIPVPDMQRAHTRLMHAERGLEIPSSQSHLLLPCPPCFFFLLPVKLVKWTALRPLFTTLPYFLPSYRGHLFCCQSSTTSLEEKGHGQGRGCDGRDEEKEEWGCTMYPWPYLFFLTLTLALLLE